MCGLLYLICRGVSLSGGQKARWDCFFFFFE